MIIQHRPPVQVELHSNLAPGAPGQLIGGRRSYLALNAQMIPIRYIVIQLSII